MIQQLAVLNEEKELLKGSHQCNRHNFQDFEKFLCVQRFELFRGHPTREIPKDGDSSFYILILRFTILTSSKYQFSKTTAFEARRKIYPSNGFYQNPLVAP